MRPPRRIVVGPHRYSVALVPYGILEGAGSDGTCQPRHLVIALDDRQPPSQLADTLCHELAHALCATLKLEDDVEEQVALAFGPALLGLIRDNPRLVTFLQAAR